MSLKVMVEYFSRMVLEGFFNKTVSNLVFLPAWFPKSEQLNIFFEKCFDLKTKKVLKNGKKCKFSPILYR